MKSIVLYLHVHQPYRLRPYTIFDIGERSDYFASTHDTRSDNAHVLQKVAEKSYLPTNKLLKQLLDTYPEFKFSLSLSGTVIEQLQTFAPHVLETFIELTQTGRVEIVDETYHHSLAFFYSLNEFEIQVNMHTEMVQRLFGQTPTAFRNTELAYNNDLAVWAERSGYKTILSEGWDPVLGWRSPNFVYRPVGTENIRLLTKNYKLSDDLAFRFGDRNWAEWPLTVDKYLHWIDQSGDTSNINLFMDYETFGEHQWSDSGIFDFLEHLPGQWLKTADKTFMTVTEAAYANKPVDVLDMPQTVTWADTERDLSAWVGNPMQHESLQALYGVQDAILHTNDLALIEDWRKLQTSDHFYYMCTKWFNDGDIHAYFSPYSSPYDAHINFMNAWHDIQRRILEKGVEL